MLHPNQTVVRMPVNQTGRDFFFGDLHGCLPHLRVLMKAVRFNPDRDRLFSVGDLIDHGSHSFEILERLQDWPFFHAVVGNHEAMAMAYRSMPGLFNTAGRIWHENGGAWSVHLTDEQWRFADRVFAGMPLAIEVPLRDGTRVGLVHAEFPASLDWSEIDQLEVEKVRTRDRPRLAAERDVIWGRDVLRAVLHLRGDSESGLPSGVRLREQYIQMMDEKAPQLVKPVSGIDLLIAGHSVTPDRLPIVAGNRWWIDTGAHWKEHENPGRLTLVEPLTRKVWQAHWRKDRLGPLKAVTGARLQ